jgi:UDP-4-amino-4,6-dideoxy-L-N-acetyl-beta-L-altrosamine transaminase
MREYIPYAQHTIDDEDIRHVNQAMTSGVITRGKMVEAFEQEIGRYCDVPYVVAFNSGTTALHAACHVFSPTSHDRIITTPNTFVGTISGAMGYGCKLELVDIDEKTGNIEHDALVERVLYCSSRGRNIVIPVHYSGIAFDTPRFERELTDPDTHIIEDACHALGSLYPNGEKVGSGRYSDMTVFSFHPAKTITTGEGGAVTTRNEEYYRRLLSFRNNGIERSPEHMSENPGPWYYDVVETTGNYNVTELQAALGVSQMKKVEGFVSRRRHLMGLYRQHLKSVKNVVMSPASYDESTGYHLCSVQIDFGGCGTTRKDVMEALHDRGIGTQVHYVPLYRHPFYKNMYKGNTEPSAEDYPHAEAFYSKELTLPLFPAMSDEDVAHICETLKSILKSQKKVAL